MKYKIVALGMSVLLCGVAFTAEAASVLTEKGYALEKLLIFSRHNIRASLAGNIDVSKNYSNRKWDTAEVVGGHLTYKGGAAETLMGEYYRAYLEDEKLIPMDWKPAKDDVRFYANSFQRTIATAKHFTAGLSPISNIDVEYHYEIDKRDPVFLPSSKIVDAKLFEQAAAWYDKLENGQGQKAFYKKQGHDVRELERILDFKNSTFAKKVGIKRFDESKFEIIAKDNRIYGNKYVIKPYQLADSVIMRYYDNPNDKEVVWNISKNSKALKAAGKILTDGGDMIWKNPIYARNMTRNLLPEIVSELKSNHTISFLCGHDTNLGTLVAALNVEDYELPQTITPHTPIGGKIVIEKRRAKDGQYYASMEMVYANDKQLRNLEILSLQNPPMKESLIIKGLNRNSDGLYVWNEFVKYFENVH